ncbi:MAG: hypothetical protein PGN13_02375 [Patulibacter minatonensis]
MTRAIDVLVVSLGATPGLRTVDDQFAGLLREVGASVELVRPPRPRDVRTLMLTDLVQARACAAVARQALREVEPSAIVYCSTTAALRWPRPGAIRFDALAQRTRPGHHGLWQRPIEARRLGQASTLLPQSEVALDGAAPADRDRAVVVPVAIEPHAEPSKAVHAAVDELLAPLIAGRLGAAAVAYASDPVKKGLDRVIAAWDAVRKEGEVLLVAGHDALPPDVAGREGVLDVGRVPREVFRALVRAVGTLVIAPRREDYGLVQLEALAEGARVVTTVAPGPYAALPLIRTLWPEQVVDRPDDLSALGRALRLAVDARPDAAEALRAAHAVGEYSHEAVLAVVRDRVLPALLGSAGNGAR